MKLLTLFLLLGLSSSLYSQQCDGCRYISEVFDSVDVVQDVKFGEGINTTGALQELFLDIYSPHGDTVTNRPVMIVAFGGGFLYGTRKDAYVEKICRFYAKTGYVAAAVDYRYGIKLAQPPAIQANEQIRVLFRAMQDMRAAVQYFKHAADSGNIYAIDSNLIFLGGVSAGAMSAIYSQYCDSPEKIGQIGDTTEIQQFGGFWSTSSLYPGYNWKAAAVCNIAGAIYDTAWIEAGDAPIISVHGDQDATVSYTEQQSGDLLSFYGFYTEGSFLIDQRAKQVGVCSYLYTIVGGDHPTSSAEQYYYDNIFNRWMPRMHAIINRRSFCCNMSLDISGHPAVGGSGSPAYFDAIISNAQGNTTTQWCAMPCNFSSNQNAITVTPDTGQYYIALAYDNNCQATDFVEITKYTSIFSPADFEISLFPSPANRQLLIKTNTTDAVQLNVKLFDVNGKLWSNQVFYGQTTLDVAEIATGLYIVEIQFSDNEVWREKVLITH